MTPKKPFVHVITAVLAWLVLWCLTQGLFMSEFLQKLYIDINLIYLLATAWVAMVACISVSVLPHYRKKILPKSKLLWLYSIPAVLLILLPSHYQLPLALPVYILMITITVFWQDYLTFGLLQTRLEKILTKNIAAPTTALLFMFGHLVFYLNSLLDPQFILLGIAGFVFAFSRRYMGNIYIANILHLCFYLI